MNNTNANRRSSLPPAVAAALAVPAPRSRGEAQELRELLEAHLHAMQALLEEHRRVIGAALRTPVVRAELRAEMRALAETHAPWVHAMAETRALLYVALRELVTGGAAGEPDPAVTVRFTAPAASADPHACATIRYDAAKLAAELSRS